LIRGPFRVLGAAIAMSERQNVMLSMKKNSIAMSVRVVSIRDAGFGVTQCPRR
jgi:hypothetical protein